MTVSQELPKTDPRVIGFNELKETEEFKIAVDWIKQGHYMGELWFMYISGWKRALETAEGQKPPTNTASHPLAFCRKLTVVECKEYDPASGNCQKCEIRPTAGE